ncbi:MAG: hypothetical protein UT31_C0003G0002 [Parcubacteria group bacterium GW2011_GWF2_39_13b]|nr:MAG: hypothetical protein UT31_C0003G0002 [Parcubacteria group bacterium GW2011_GWF2_39_13b]
MATVNFAFILVDNLFFTIIGSVLFVTVLLIFLRVVIVPLTKLTAACEQVRKGNLDVKIENNHQTEINEFIGTFNEMVAELKKSRAAMEEAKDILEIRVKARTRQLQEIIDGQETTIRSRTKELEEQIKELERFRRLTVDRELKMINLKKEIKKLKSPTKND